MTKLQAQIAGYGLVVIGAVLSVVGAILKNDSLTVTGGGLAFAGLTALGLPRPKDVSE